MVFIYKNSVKIVFLIISMMLLVACGGFFGAKVENKSKEKLSNEELIDMALEDFIGVGNYDSFISRACPRSPTIDDIREVTDIKIWDGKYIELVVKGELNENPFLPLKENNNHKFYKYEDGYLEDSYRFEGSKMDSTNAFDEDEIRIMDTEPDYSEENDGVYFLEYVGCDKEKE